MKNESRWRAGTARATDASPAASARLTGADSRPLRTVDVLGMPISIVTRTALIDELLSRSDRREPTLAVGVNTHVAYLQARLPSFAEHLRRAEFLYADGASVVWASRLLRGPLPERVATTDLAIPLTVRAANKGKRIYFLGGRPGVAEAAARRLRRKVPSLQIRTHDGRLDRVTDEALTQDIRDFGTDILFVGLGDPLQSQWVQRNTSRLEPMTVLTCGGLFDWLSGRNRRAPALMIRLGLEWLWRFMLEPRRLGRRYLVGNPEFAFRVLRQRLREGGRRRLAPRERPAPAAGPLIEQPTSSTDSR